MNFGKNFSLAALLVFGATFASADTVLVQNGSATWQSWTASDLSEDGIPYFDRHSADGGEKNIGYCLTGTGACGMKNPPGAIPYLGTSDKTAYPDFYFNNTSGKSTAAMQIEIAGDIKNDTFGWFNVANSNDKHVIVSGAVSGGTTFTFTPSSQYGFYLTNATPGINETFYSDSWLNQGDDSGVQHFALFQQSPGTYYLGAEDLPKCISDMDYNDMVLKISSVSTPEPGSVALLGGGLLSLGALRLRRRKMAITA